MSQDSNTILQGQLKQQGLHTTRPQFTNILYGTVHQTDVSIAPLLPVGATSPIPTGMMTVAVAALGSNYVTAPILYPGGVAPNPGAQVAVGFAPDGTPICTASYSPPVAGVLPITEGGTGATTAAGALTNLGAASETNLLAAEATAASATAAEVTRAEAAEALLAPTASPTLTGTVTATGSIVSTGGIQFGSSGPAAGPDVHSDGTNIYVETNGAGTIYLRPNGYGSNTNMATLSSAGVFTTPIIASTRITKRVLALSANSATPAINTDLYDVVHITAQTATITSFTTGLTGTPVDGDTLRISITGTASVPFTLGSSFEASSVVIPTTTVGTTRLDMGFFWNTETTKWRLMASA